MVQPATQRPREVLAERVASFPLARLERLCVVFLFVAALLPRLRDITAPFDRGADGERGAHFAVAALNYERGDAAGAYPVLNIDRVDSEDQRLVDADQPPIVPLLAWNAVRVLGPEGWDSAWKDGNAPEGIELPLRVPFLAAQLLALLLLWSVAREAYGAAVGLLTLALGAASSVGIQFAGLVDYANPGLATALLVVLFSLRWMRNERRPDLALAGAASALGAAVTYGALAFLPALWITAWRRCGPRKALIYSAVTAACASLPLVMHHFAAQAALADSSIGAATIALEGRNFAFEPAVEAEFGFGAWLAIQWRNAVTAHGAAIIVATMLALALRSARALSPRLDSKLSSFEGPARETRDQPLLGILCAGAAISLFAIHGRDSAAASSFQLWWLPAFSLGGALCLQLVSGPLLRLRAGLSPLALLTLGLALPGLGTQAAWRMRTRGAESEVPLPSTIGAWIAESTQPGDFVVHDRALGLNRAAGFYAWRSTLAAAAPDDPAVARFARASGRAKSPRYWLSADSNDPSGRTAQSPAANIEQNPARADATWRLERIEASATEDF